eukprot:5525189-Heterocapsa_arctica.AAC.1
MSLNIAGLDLPSHRLVRNLRRRTSSCPLHFLHRRAPPNAAPRLRAGRARAPERCPCQLPAARFRQ